MEKSRQKLIEELNDMISRSNLHVTLVFDGAEESSRGHYDAIEIVYTPKTSTADEYIFEEVTRSRIPAQITVVTNDRPLANRCRIERAKTMTTDQFLALVMKKKQTRKKVRESAFRESDRELTRLLLIFEKKLLENLTKELD